MSRTWIEQVSKAELELVHGPFIPASVYPGMGVGAVLCLGDKDIPLRIWRLSPQGIEFECIPELNFEVGQAVFIKLSLAGQSIAYHAIVVSRMHQEREICLVGVKYESRSRPEKPTNAQREARVHKRWQVNRRYYPTGVASSALTFYGDMLFTVADVSSSGMRIFTSLRNKFLIPGLTFKAKIYFPPVGQVEIKMMIRNIDVVREGDDLMQAIGTQIVERDKDFSKAVGQYILQFGEGQDVISPVEVKSQNLNVDNAADIVEWGFAHSPNDRDQVQALRQEVLPALQQSGIEEARQADILDAHSRLLVGRFRGEIIATLRLTFCSTDDDRFAAERYFELPRSMGMRREMTEISLLCIRKDFDRKELTMGLLRFAFSLILQSSRRHALCVCDRANLKMFRRMGFKDTEMPIKTRLTPDKQPRLLIADIHQVAVGKHVGPITWNKIFRGREAYLCQSRWDKSGVRDNVRLAAYRILGPLSMVAQQITNRQWRS